jgi:DNA gyrase subunit A
LSAEDRLVWCQRCTDQHDVLVGTRGGMATRFAVSKLRPTGRTSRGVRTMRLRKHDKISDVNVVTAGTFCPDDENELLILENANGDETASGLCSSSKEYVLAVSSLGYGKRIPTQEFRTQARGGVGVVALKFKKSMVADEMTCLRAVKETDEIMVVTAKGIMVRQQVSNIPSQGRTATGVLIQKLDDGDHISSVSIVPEYEESD